MSQWWLNLDSFARIFWYLAIPFSLLFFIKLFLTFYGIDEDFGDIDGLGVFSFFTLRNFIAFFTVFAWSGITFYNAGFTQRATVLIALIIGLVVMLLITFLFYFISKLAETGNMDLKQAQGLTAKVYLTIPPKRSGTGKIHINFQDSLKEVNAMTDGEKIKTGTMVKVIDVIDNKILLVE